MVHTYPWAVGAEKEEGRAQPRVVGNLRRWVDLIQEAPAIFWVEDPSKPPGAVLERLHIHYFDEQEVAGLSALDLERARQVVDPGQVDVADIVGTVVISYLSASPIEAFDLDCLAILNLVREGDCRW